MEKKTQPCQEAQALLLFPLSRRLLANNNSRFFLKSCKRNKSKKAYVDVWNDFLSELPNEIALEILSKLPMKEVARLSLVSQKWRKVWQCYPILNFEDSRPTKRVGKKERHAFVSRVNRILDQHLGHSIDEFKVIFNLDSRSASDIDKWVAFACAKQVKRLELDFDTDSSGRYEKYTWPIQYQMPHNYHTWGHALASLSLKCVNITTETVECFLNSFPSLEILCISQTNVLTTIRACSLSLKHLEVTLCFGLNTIVLDAPKLLSFRYEGSTIKLHLNNVSSLSVVSLGTLARDYPIAYAFDPCLNYYAQLEYLELKMNLCGKMQLNQQIDHCPVLTNLKHLTLFCFTNHDQSLLGWTSLINASPVLQKLTLKLIIASFCRSYSRREIQKCDGHPLKCLKTLEIVGLEGYCVDLELVMYVLENAIMLEEVVIDTRSPFSEKDSKPDLMAQIRAMKLSSKLPQGAKLIFK